ncbi:MAG TPA: phage holin family protein [Thermodesulfobacteriota bacterium]|nr:phage holin family protein [Deltaproteobacteria bacterium]HNR13791.1 phage holin family protein [Thermodesulfobacteriota bacterium]HNU71453.1 phage holin family protein [Thermodesulfobacteriota bacterium]
MKGILLRWLILTIAIMAAGYLIEGIRVSGFWSAVITAGFLGILNAFFRPILIILTLPLNILTLGLFTFVINALMLKMASGILASVEVEGFWSAVLGSVVISLVSWGLNSFIEDSGHIGVVELRKRDGDRWE